MHRMMVIKMSKIGGGGKKIAKAKSSQQETNYKNRKSKSKIDQQEEVTKALSMNYLFAVEGVG